jgi:hypothetical protein
VLCTTKSRQPIIESAAYLSAQSAPALAKLAGVAMDACKNCEAECLKHKSQAPCQACADACAVCYAECKKMA